MKAKFVYEALGDILKPKTTETIMKDFGENFNEIFKNTMISLVKRGYEINPIPEIKKDYEENQYSIYGKRIITGDGAWIKLKASEEIDEYPQSSWFEELPERWSLDFSTDSIIHLMKLEDGTYIIEVTVNLRGQWSDYIHEEDDNESEFKRIVKKEEEIIPTVLDLVLKAEKFLESKINELKELLLK